MSLSQAEARQGTGVAFPMSCKILQIDVICYHEPFDFSLSLLAHQIERRRMPCRATMPGSPPRRRMRLAKEQPKKNLRKNQASIKRQTASPCVPCTVATALHLQDMAKALWLEASCGDGSTIVVASSLFVSGFLIVDGRWYATSSHVTVPKGQCDSTRARNYSW